MPDMENVTKGGRVSGLRWIKTCRTPKMHHIGHVSSFRQVGRRGQMPNTKNMANVGQVFHAG